jgi:subtilisin family serine protease
VSLSLKTDPLYQYQWHLDSTGQNNFASSTATSGEDLNVASPIVSGYDGTDVMIAVVDDGLEIAHEDLTDNVVVGGSYNFIDGGTDPTESSGLNSGHGTSVAGIIGAKGWNDIGVRGVAPDSDLVGFNFVSRSSYYFYGFISEATFQNEEAEALGQGSFARDVDIFNMSYGSAELDQNLTDFYASTLSDAIEWGAANLRGGLGAIYVESAGNDFDGNTDDNLTYENTAALLSSYCGAGTNAASSGFKIGCYEAAFEPSFQIPEVIAVGALNSSGVKASYSTPGAALWISAPGGERGMNSSIYGGLIGSSDTLPGIMTTGKSSCSRGSVRAGSGYVVNSFQDGDSPHSENPSCSYTSTFAGTSAAAPTVTGVVAQMLEANPALTWRDVKHILASTARQVDTTFDATDISGVTYLKWRENSAGFKFHNWYGFGAIDANAAVNAALSYTAGQLGSQKSLSLTTTNLDTSFELLATNALTVTQSGVAEYVRVSVQFTHDKPNQLGFRLVSPNDTVSTLLMPLTRMRVDSDNGWIRLPTNAFYEEQIQGDWELQVIDHVSGTTGTLNDWYLWIDYR